MTLLTSSFSLYFSLFACVLACYLGSSSSELPNDEPFFFVPLLLLRPVRADTDFENSEDGL